MAETRSEVLLMEAREELVRADQKAALLLSASGVGLGALLAALMARSWTPTVMAGPAQFFWWLGAACLGVAIALLGRAVCPQTVSRTPRLSPDLVAYYADVVRVGRDALDDAISKGSTESAVQDQLFSISEIVAKKYVDIRAALFGLAGGAILILVSIAVNAWA